MGLLGKFPMENHLPRPWRSARPGAGHDLGHREKREVDFFDPQGWWDWDVGVTLRETNIAMENPHFQ